MWDSTTVGNGCAIDYITVGVTGSDTVSTYPALAGRSVSVQPMAYHWYGALTISGSAPGSLGVTTDTTLGYPRVTIPAGSSTRSFIVYADVT